MAITAAPPTAPTASSAGSGTTGRQSRRNTLIGWSFILPNFLGFALLTLVPVVAAFGLAFMEWDSYNPAEFVGLDNFQKMFGNDTFWIALRNTLYYGIGHVPLTLLCSLGLALVLNRKLRGVRFFRTAAFFPYVTSLVAVAVVWNMLFNPTMGPVNQLLHHPRRRQPARLDVQHRLGDARGHHHQRLAGHGLLHDPVPGRPADHPRRVLRGRPRRRRQRLAAVLAHHAADAAARPPSSS